MITLQRAITDGESALVTGQPGTGRTAVLEELGAQRGGRVLWVRGKDSLEGAPMAPFAPILAEYGADLSDTLKIYTEFTLELAGESSLLLVDDIDCLDRASAVLVSQLHRAGATVVGSTAPSSSLPAGLHELARKWRPVDLAPLEPRDIAGIAQADLQAPLLAPTLTRLVPAVGGRPGVLVSILDEARVQGLLTRTPAGIRVGELPVTAPALAAAGFDLSAVEPYRDVLETLTVCGELPESLFDPSAVTELARNDLVAADGEVVRLTDQLWHAWTLFGLSRDLRRRVMLQTAQRLPTDERWGPRGEVLRSCALGTGDVGAAARWLQDQGRVAEAADLFHRLGDHAEGDRFSLALLQADIHLELGSVADAVRALDDAEEALVAGSGVDALVERWITALGGRPDHEVALRERVGRVLDRIEDPVAHQVVLAAWRRRQVIVGFQGHASHLEPAHDDPVVVALRESMTGSLEIARAAATPAEVGDFSGDSDLDEQFRVLAHFLSLVYDGRLVEGREIAQRHYRTAHDQARPTLGLWTYNLAKIAFHAGQYDDSAKWAAEARRHLAWCDVAGQSLPADAMLAAALARLGRQSQAESITDGLSDEDRALPRVRIGVARVEAEAMRTQGKHAEAADLLAQAGQYAVAQDEAHSGLLAVDESFMISHDPAVADLLLSLRDKSALVAGFADRAAAIVRKDPEGLVEVAARFEQMIQPGRAAHAWSVAGQLFEARRRGEQARRARQNAVRVSTLWQVTPWPTERPDETVLTAREYEIALRASGRQRSREIADALDLSVRTVDNHLARTYRKLGIAGRDGLAEALDLTV